MKGLFLPEITTEDFRDGCLESIEALIGEGEIYDIDYSEPCEDAISRQAVLDATVKRNSIWNKITNSKGENLEEIISQLPPVAPKGVTVTDFADRCRECGKQRRCKTCKYFEYDSVAARVGGIPLIVHEICSRWGGGCKTNENGYCHMYEPQESEG